MALIQSLQDLAQAREDALKEKRARYQKQRYHIQVGMASCGIAAGASETWNALNRLAENISNLVDSDEPGDVSPSAIRITQTGCIGLCSLEPLVQVQVGSQPVVTYGKVTPEVARRIMAEHITKGLIVQEYVVENI